MKNKISKITTTIIMFILSFVLFAAHCYVPQPCKCLPPTTAVCELCAASNSTTDHKESTTADSTATDSTPVDTTPVDSTPVNGVPFMERHPNSDPNLDLRIENAIRWSITNENKTAALRVSVRHYIDTIHGVTLTSTPHSLGGVWTTRVGDIVFVDNGDGYAFYLNGFVFLLEGFIELYEHGVLTIDQIQDIADALNNWRYTPSGL